MGTVLPESTSSEAEAEPSRKERRGLHRRSRRKVATTALAVTFGLATVAGIGIALNDSSDSGASAAPTRRSTTTSSSSTTSTAPTTTTTTLPTVTQPPAAVLPPVTGSLGQGSSGDVVRAYQQRLLDLHFDPGPVDGNFGGAMSYAVQALQKLENFPRTGRIGPGEALSLAVFQYPTPLQPTGEANRTEIDVSKQVITLYENYQVRLITTTSTGSGQHYCYDSPRVNPTRHICEVATTPSGRFTYTRFVSGWDKSPLGQLYQPYYFNGGIAVHGYTSVPTDPASHGCARIPMHIAEYFHTLVKVGDPVYVFGGTPAQILSSVAISPPPTTPTTAPAPPAPTQPPVAPAA